MKCLAYVLMITVLMNLSPCGAQEAKWQQLSATCDPPGRPSVRAARIATQGLRRDEMWTRLNTLLVARQKGRSTANGSALAILKREIELLEVALEDR